MIVIGLRNSWDGFYLAELDEVLVKLGGSYVDCDSLRDGVRSLLERNEFRVEKPQEFATFFGLDIYDLYLTLEQGKPIIKDSSSQVTSYLKNSHLRRYFSSVLINR